MCVCGVCVGMFVLVGRGERKRKWLCTAAVTNNSAHSDHVTDQNQSSNHNLPWNQDTYSNNSDQLISPQDAYIMTSLLTAVIQEPGGTGGRARGKINQPVAGKTGTTNGYYDAWFIGYTPSVIAGVWVGFDNEQSLGIGETGSRAALPIWLNFMKTFHEDQDRKEFAVPEGIVFTHVDNNTGQLVSEKSTHIVNQAFVEGTQPSSILVDSPKEIEAETDTEQNMQDFLRRDLSQ